jgi:hypothetical protein
MGSSLLGPFGEQSASADYRVDDDEGGSSITCERVKKTSECPQRWLR